MEDDERASRIAGEGVLDILAHADRWERLSEISDLLSSPHIRKAIIFHYVEVLDFLVSSTHWLGKSSLRKCLS